MTQGLRIPDPCHVKHPYTAFRSSAAAVGERSLHAAFRQVLSFASSTLLLLSGFCASWGGRQLSALTTALAQCIKQVGQ